jgi:hypothetical protein
VKAVPRIEREVRRDGTQAQGSSLSSAELGCQHQRQQHDERNDDHHDDDDEQLVEPTCRGEPRPQAGLAVPS